MVSAIREIFRSIMRGLAQRARGVILMALAMMIALVGQAAGAGLLSALDALGFVDFSAVDASRTAAFYVLLLVFCIQIALVLIGVANSGFRFIDMATGLALLAWALSMLMIHYVALQCGLYDECL